MSETANNDHSESANIDSESEGGGILNITREGKDYSMGLDLAPNYEVSVSSYGAFPKYGLSPRQMRDYTRLYIIKRLFSILCFLVFFTIFGYVFVLFSLCQEEMGRLDKFVVIFDKIWTPLIGLTSGVMGFYFGTKEK